MFLTRQIKVKPDDAAKILAKENGRICTKINFSADPGYSCNQLSERGVGIYDEFCRWSYNLFQRHPDRDVTIVAFFAA